MRVHVLPRHVQPAPSIDANVSPEGGVSVTVIVPLVAALPGALEMVNV